MVFLSVSCIDRDILNISDSLEIHSRYSLPVGIFPYDINDYLESLAAVSVSTPDSLYFDDGLYPNIMRKVGFSSSDSFAFNIVRDPSEKVRSIELIFLISNGYPTDISAQVYFLTGSSTDSPDSVFTGGPVTIDAADLNDDGVVTEPSISILSFFMPPEFIHKLSLISGIMIRGYVNTTRMDFQKVKFYGNYQITMRIGSRIELKYNTDEI